MRWMLYIWLGLGGTSAVAQEGFEELPEAAEEIRQPTELVQPAESGAPAEPEANAAEGEGAEPIAEPVDAAEEAVETAPEAEGPPEAAADDEPAAGEAVDEADDDIADADEVGEATEEEGEAADEDGEAVAAESPEAAPVELAEVDAAFHAGRYQEARAGYAALARQTPEAPVLRYRLAAAAALAGAPAEAEGQAAHAERLDPGNLPAAQLAFAARKARGAASPDLLAARLALADGRLRTAERLAADAMDEAAVEARGALQRVRGQALLALGRGAAAFGALKAAAASGQADPLLWLQLAEAARIARAAEAAQDFYGLAAAGAPMDHPAADRARARGASMGRARTR